MAWDTCRGGCDRKGSTRKPHAEGPPHSGHRGASNALGGEGTQLGTMHPFPMKLPRSTLLGGERQDCLPGARRGLGADHAHTTMGSSFCGARVWGRSAGRGGFNGSRYDGPGREASGPLSSITVPAPLPHWGPHACALPATHTAGVSAPAPTDARKAGLPAVPTRRAPPRPPAHSRSSEVVPLASALQALQ